MCGTNSLMTSLSQSAPLDSASLALRGKCFPTPESFVSSARLKPRYRASPLTTLAVPVAFVVALQCGPSGSRPLVRLHGVER